MRNQFTLIFAGMLWLAWPGDAWCATDSREPPQVSLGRLIFSDASLSRDGTVSCKTCHDPAHAYADSHRRGIGVSGVTGTRNAPSLVGISADETFFWDGRRDKLEDAVLDPFTNPVELGLANHEELLTRIRQEAWSATGFRRAYPKEADGPTLNEVRDSLAAFIRSLPSGTSVYDQAEAQGTLMSPEAQLGRTVFEGSAGCAKCHKAASGNVRFSDGSYHHSGIGMSEMTSRLPAVTRSVVDERLDPSALGPRVLSNQDWSALGRFIVTARPADIGAFRTPSLRNVAVTAPYMHDGSIATLAEAVDREIYYHSSTQGNLVHISAKERHALVAFLEALTDETYLVTLTRGGSEKANLKGD